MADVNLSQDEQQRLQEAFAGFDSGAEALTESIDLTGTKDMFCNNWQTVKNVLSFIANLPLIPASVRAAIGLVIKAGDMAHGALCRG